MRSRAWAASNCTRLSRCCYRLLVHLLKAEAWPLSREVSHWQAEARLHRAQATLRFAPSMRQRLGSRSGLYAKAGAGAAGR